ncbi:DUF2274 domain-containing protein [Sphingomonas abietis]|uniref:DUF2274 domain-containing protein n=1 Tax=Sphingomonas abietis TaxID=3012344 RepID=A0ABY7NTK8_9SPHN|nr:DUF2274 domain-containing protein [Sphingomonas abietis]WBO24482.1 DUF2274 domain-containing protein [Sphingomonas abietis]
MIKLKLDPIVQDKPVRVSVDLPGSLFEDLKLYGALLAGEGAAVEPPRLIVPMLQRFVATDRAFARARRSSKP